MNHYRNTIICKKNSTEKNNNFFGGTNVIHFRDMIRLPPVIYSQVFNQPDYLAPATHLWWLFHLVELTENMRQQRSTIFVDIFKCLRTKICLYLRTNERVDSSEDGEFSIEKTLKIHKYNKRSSIQRQQKSTISF